MESEFITYQRFSDPALAQELVEMLSDHHIPYQVEEQSFRFDPSFVLTNAQVEYAVKIKSADFDAVNRLLDENADIEVEGVEKDHYLFKFTDDELTEVVEKADEWSKFDVALARKILGDRGKPISKPQLAAMHEHRVGELREAEPPQTLWVIVGYIIALTGVLKPFYICAIGLFIGWHLWTYKKTLPNGERVFGYRETDRKHGKRIFYLSIIVFVVSVLVIIIYPKYF